MPRYRRRAVMGVLVSLLLLGVALAGCSDSDDEVAGGGNRPPSGIPGSNPISTEGEGTIVGVVLTADFEPIDSARVRLLVDGQEAAQTLTSGQGGFRLEDVPAGRHRLDVSASCCRDDVVRVVVEKDQTTKVNIRLEPLGAADSRRPYAVLTPWEGFISCGVALDVIHESCTQDLDPSDDRSFSFNVTEGLATLYVRIDWNETTTFVGDQLRLRVMASEDRLIATQEGPGPIELLIQDADIEDPELAWSAIEGQRGLTLRVDAGGTSLAWQQSFDVHIIEFYWMAAPDDFSFTPQ